MKYDKDDKISSIIEEIINIYTSSCPGSDCFDIWRTTGISLRAIEEILTISCHNHSEDETIKFFLPRYNLAENDHQDFVSALQSFS